MIGFFFIDEAHFTAGEPKPGEKLAFRTAYGKLAEVLLHLTVDVLVTLFFLKKCSSRSSNL